MTLVERIVTLHRALAKAEVPHAFGGALALAWCTERARGTIDIDINLFVDSKGFEVVEGALPDGIEITDQDREAIAADGQVRLWWEATPVDVFCNTTPFHEAASRRVRIEPFGGADVPFLACRDLAVFKAFSDRTKDWADLEEMHAAGTLDLPAVLGTIVEYLGAGDHCIERLRALSSR